LWVGRFDGISIQPDSLYLGNEAVDWLVREKGVTRREAVELGETLRLDGYLVNAVYRDQPFLDGHFFYRFCIPRRLSDESLAKLSPSLDSF